MSVNEIDVNAVNKRTEEEEEKRIAGQNPCEYCEEGGRLIEADAGSCDNCNMNCCGSCMTGSEICDACKDGGFADEE